MLHLILLGIETIYQMEGIHSLYPSFKIFEIITDFINQLFQK